MRELLEFIRNGGRTKRFHTKLTLTPNTVAAHSFGVAWLCWVLTEGSPSAQLLMAALAHDLAEWKTGDLAAPTKRALGLREVFAAYEDSFMVPLGLSFKLGSDEERILKLADAMDGMAYCIEEKMLGNTGLEVVFNNFSSYVGEIKCNNVELEVLGVLYEAWGEIT